MIQHVEVGIPEPKVDEVLIKVEAIALNAADWKIQEGMVRPFFPLKFPMIPGSIIYPVSLNLLWLEHKKRSLNFIWYPMK